MASFVVETYVPQGDQERFAADVDGIRLAAEAIVVVDGRVHHVRSYLVPGDEMGFHVVEADSADDVVRLAKLAGIEVERIAEAIDIGPGRSPDDRSDGAR
jgi:hypothetical protein